MTTTNQKHRPKKLEDVYGQEAVTAYFKAVVRHPEKAARNYVFFGGSGVGKTSIARAFASELACQSDDPLQSNNYMEFDSSQLSNKKQVEDLLPYIFSEVDGWKVVLFDEAHLVPAEIQQLLLKPLEDFVGQIFFIFATTETEGLAQTLVNRCLPFTLRSFSDAEQRDYLQQILAKEDRKVSEAFLDLAVFSAGGHLRNLLNQIDLLNVLGEDQYLVVQSQLHSAVKSYFLHKGQDKIEALCRFPFVMVQNSIDRFFRAEVIQSKKYFRSADIGKIYMTYLKFKTVVRTDQDFYSVLHLWKDFFQASLLEQT